MLKISLLLLCCGVLSTLSCRAQNGLIFTSKNFDFGTLSESDSSAVCEFEFYNRSSKILIVNRVVSSCGCVKVDFQSKPLRMGESGSIKVRFNPQGQSGRFYKPIYVYNNLSKQPTELIVRGVVEAQQSPEYLYPYELCGKIRANVQSLNLGYAAHGRFAVGKIELYNSGNESVMIETSEPESRNIKLQLTSNKIESGQRVSLGVIYEAADSMLWGTVNHVVRVKIDDEEIILPVSVVVVEDFSLDSDNQDGTAPKLYIDQQLFHLGEVESGSVKNVVVGLKNVGKKELIIRKINASCELLSASVEMDTLETKRKSELTLSVKCVEMGRLNEYIELITNDSERPMRRVRIVANVVKSKN